ncbi:TniQ family protein [Alicyclobacillus mengziensis]|nr:TniQ family protein [Alicyclobacillus mengziensis]
MYPGNVNEEVVSEPTRSYLYHLTPICNGPYTESLTSYTSRLSEAHGLTMAEFLKEVLSSVLGKPYLHAIVKHGGTRFLAYSGAQNGLARGAEQLVQELQYLTKVENLQQLTFLPYRELFSDRGLIRRFRSWCPRCYQEWMDTNVTVYDPLLWSVQNIDYCPIHHIELAQICPKCGRHLFHWERYSRPGYCTCGNWLGNSGAISDFTSETYQDRHNQNYTFGLLRSKNIGTVIELAQGKRLPRVSAQQIMSHLLTLTDGNMALLARRAGLSKSTVFGWTQGRRIPLQTFIHITERLHLELNKVLLCSPCLTAPNSNIASSSKVVVSTHRQYPSSQPQDAELLLQAELHSDPPNSLQSIAKTMGLDRKLLHTKFPTLTQQIRKRYRDYT